MKSNKTKVLFCIFLLSLMAIQCRNPGFWKNDSPPPPSPIPTPPPPTHTVFIKRMPVP